MQFTIELKQANESEYEILKNIHHISMKKHVSQIWGWNEDFQNKFFKDNFDSNNIQIIKRDDKIAGYLDCWESETDTHFLMRFNYKDKDQPSPQKISL